ncbi:RES family NAD+ phosphorylase [Cupriavidus agavae]|uniref:RES domain-containing protein n=1 Tax=Cupriavidus agavae TaxID=1001822 RepID=A0A4Q7RYV7_9BURK|nr:RES family NAD+ phosphorylase [Cupriavidus agavae]RZT38398.1 RES domain-containing protein [Cupriavidus agavae]
MTWTITYNKKPNLLDPVEHPPLACSLCFSDHGLQLDAQSFEPEYTADLPCPNCNATGGKKLPKEALEALAHRFFVWGSLWRTEYGGAPRIQFNDKQSTSINPSSWLKSDVALFERLLGIGFFHYGPRLWMIGEVTPLKDLQEPSTRSTIIDRIIREYPSVTYAQDKAFYRVRLAPKVPDDPLQYDSPPEQFLGTGRIDSAALPILYGSPDLETCLHECRITADDETFVATMRPTRELKLLNLAALLREEDTTEFESLDMAIHMLFLAGKHAYEIIREIALGARNAGYDGIIYPSYFSLIRLGIMPFQTTYGISHRRVQSLQDHEESKAIPNLALFGRPVLTATVEILCINRILLKRVEYGYHFGPATF